MPNIATVVDRLNDAVRRDWKAMHNLVEYRVPANTALAEHPSIIVVPQEVEGSLAFLVGLLGILNGTAREDSSAQPIEATFDDATNELTGFRLRGDDSPVVDQRAVELKDIQEGRRYRAKDRAGNFWEGVYTGPGQPPGEQGLHLRLADGSTALIYFHDVAHIIYA